MSKRIKIRFNSSIKRGTGEAFLLINSYQDIDFSKEIIKASLKNFSYDGQCEDSRAPYLFELITLSKQTELIKTTILKALRTQQTDTWSLIQLFGLAKLFALQGDQSAKNAIYERFSNKKKNDPDWAGYSEILELDGIEGLKFIAEKFGRNLQIDPEDWLDASIIKQFQDSNPELKVNQLLEEASLNNQHIKRYLDSVRESEKMRSNYSAERVVYTGIIDEVLKNKKGWFIKKLTDEEIDLIAQRLVRETDPNCIERLLLVFGRNRFPLDRKVILQLTNTNNASIWTLAVSALKFLSGDDIRKFALAEIDKSREPGILVNILKANYKADDHKLLTRLVKKFRSEDIIEGLAISYTDIYRTVATVECREPLEAIYNKSTCAIHREDVVRILAENEVLSKKIKKEIKFDCNSQVRLFADAES